MNRRKKEPTIEEAKIFIETYPIADMYVDTFFQRYLGGHNVYTDNSDELYYHWKKMKRITETPQGKTENKNNDKEV